MPQLVDVTLRDGSYDFDFKVSTEFTSALGRLLARNFNYIEIGHGMGMGAYKSRPAVSDEDCLANAARLFEGTGIQWMMIAQPGYGTTEAIAMAADYRMPMIRIAFYLEDEAEALTLIEAACNHGIRVSANYMKSHNYSPSDIAVSAGRAISAGADIIYVVDSTGSMFPAGIFPQQKNPLKPVFMMDYFNAIRSAHPDIKIGFHGHNNLGMADANALCAYVNGFDFIDVSMLGMGRGAGNSVAQRVVAGLVMLGYLDSAQLSAVMQTGEMLDTLTNTKELGAQRINARTVMAGLARFHSAQFDIIAKHAQHHQLRFSDIVIKMVSQGMAFSEENLDRVISQLT